jgi:predicted MFS family arabinose efflux permease
VRGFPRLYASLALARVSGQMLSVALVLFVLQRYGSPQLAGAATFLATFPGLLLSPIAGAVLDRYPRVRLMALDYMVAAAMLFLIAALSFAHRLSGPELLVICGLGSLTGPLSQAGARAIFPSIVPGHLWERGNALDSTSHVLSSIIGAPLAGVLVALAGGEWALAVTAVLFAAAGLAIVGVHDPGPRQRGRGVLVEAWDGLVYVLRNRTLAGLALTFFSFSVGWGILLIAVPVLILTRFHAGPSTVGYIWGAMGVAGMVATLLVGRIRTLGRERQLIAGSIVAIAVAMSVIPLAGSVVGVGAAMVAVAIVETPWDISFLTLRQRRTDPKKFGRAFAVSVALNMIGSPVGSALAGPLIAWSLTGALWFAAAVTLLAAVFPMVMIPAAEASAADG